MATVIGGAGGEMAQDGATGADHFVIGVRGENQNRAGIKFGNEQRLAVFPWTDEPESNRTVRIARHQTTLDGPRDFGELAQHPFNLPCSVRGGNDADRGRFHFGDLLLGRKRVARFVAEGKIT